MTTPIIIRTYFSDYTGKRRFALCIDGKFPPEHDYSTRDEAVKAKELLKGGAE